MDCFDTLPYQEYLKAVNFGAMYDPGLTAELANFLASNGIQNIIVDQLPAEAVLHSAQSDVQGLIDGDIVPDTDATTYSLTMRLQQYLIHNAVPFQAAQKMTATYLLKCTQVSQEQYLAENPEEPEPPQSPVRDIMDSPGHLAVPAPGAAIAENPGNDSTVDPRATILHDEEIRENESDREDSLFGENAGVFEKDATPPAQGAALSEEHTYDQGNEEDADFEEEPVEMGEAAAGPPAHVASFSDEHVAGRGSDEDATRFQEQVELGDPAFIIPSDIEPEQFYQLALGTRMAYTATRVQTPALAALVPSDDAISSNPDEDWSKFMKISVEYVATRLAAVLVVLVRAGRMQSAEAFGQFSIDLLGAGIFTNMVAGYETAPVLGDEMEGAKASLADCISMISEYHGKPLAYKLQDIVVRESMWYENVEEKKQQVQDAPARNKAVSHKKKASRGPIREGKGVAMRVTKNKGKGRAKKILTVSDPDDDYY